MLFFDEMDALAPRRGSDNNAPAERLVNQLLTEMDGIDGRVVSSWGGVMTDPGDCFRDAGDHGTSQ